MRDTHKRDNIEKIANNENLPLKVLSLDVDNDDVSKKCNTKNT